MPMSLTLAERLRERIARLSLAIRRSTTSTSRPVAPGMRALAERDLLVELGHTLGAEREAERFFPLLIERAGALFAAKAVLYLLDADDVLTPQRDTTSPECRGHRNALGHGVVGIAGRDRRGLIDNAYGTRPDAVRALGVASVARVMAQPLVLRDRLLGVLALHRVEGRPPFEHEDLATLERVAPHVAVVLDNARLSEEARAAVANLEAACDRVLRSETLRAVGELAGGAAHHLNNLLMIILGRVQLLLAGWNHEDPRRSLDTIHQAARDAAEVVRRVQQFSQEKHEGERQLLDVNKLVSDALEMTRFRWQDTANAHGIVIHSTFERSDLPPVSGDAASLREVVMNLILNAVEALPTGGQIRIETRAGADGVVVTVADDGAGMSEETRRRAADPFFTTKGIKRMGLGLSVSFGVVRRHGGTLEIDTAPGRGTVVTMRLPAERRPVPATAEPEPAATRLRKLTIVLIDDDARVREVLAAMLESQGQEVIQAGSGEEGVLLVEARSPDLVLTDLGMPGMTGWEVAHAVKARHPQLPVGLITGWADQLDHDAHGLVEFVLAKPTTAEALAEAISKAESRRRPRDAARRSVAQQMTRP
jgi:signal transduction histidine kinase/CheY-like chemotaxis protein